MLAPVLVTFGLSVMIENLLQVAATSDPRGLNGGALALASFHVGSITVSWLFLAAFLRVRGPFRPAAPAGPHLVGP